MTRNRSIVAVVGGSLLVALWYTMLLGWQRSERGRLGSQIEAAERREQELSTTRSELRRLTRDTVARKAELARLAGLVPPDTDVAGFILAANHAAIAAGVDWVSFAPGPTVAGTAGGPTSVPVGIEVRGRYPSLVSYLRRLETLDRLVVIDSIQLAAAGREPGAGLSASMTSRIFTAASSPPANGSSGRQALSGEAPGSAAGPRQ